MDTFHHIERRKQRVATAIGGVVATVALGKGISVLVTQDVPVLILASSLLLLLAGALIILGLPLLDRLAPATPAPRVPAQQRAGTSSSDRVVSARH